MKKGFGISLTDGKINFDIRFENQFFDNLYFKSQKFEFAIEGVVINQKQLIDKFAVSDPEELYSTLIQKYGIRFLNELEGEYCGAYQDFETQKLFIFMNFTATRKLFYYSKNEILLADVNLECLKNKMNSTGIPVEPDIDSAYSILVCDNLLENNSPVKDVKRLMDREYLETNLQTSKTELKSFFNYDEIERFSGNKEQALNLIQEAFVEGVKLEYGKDTELGKGHFALLSGGLDSRLALICAIKEGFQPHQTMCFSQKGYWDEIIARKISKKYNFPFTFIPLNGAEYLTDIDKVVDISDGLLRFTGGVHTNYSYKFIDRKNTGIIHSGQLGDGVLGGFNRAPYKQPPGKAKIVVSDFYWDKFSSFFDKTIQGMDSEELFYLRNIGYNRAVMGSFIAEDFGTYQCSPFMTSFYLKLVLSFSEEWKYNQKLYLEWMNKFYPEATKFIWERTLMRPDKYWKTVIGDKVVKTAYIALTAKLGLMKEKSVMANYEYYYKRSPEMISFFDNYFKANLELIENTELKSDLAKLYQAGGLDEKVRVLTVIAYAKRFFQ